MIQLIDRIIHYLTANSALFLCLGITSCPDDDSDTASEFFARGYAYMRGGNYRSALKDFTKAIEVNPEHQDAYLQRSSIFLKLDKPKEAIEDIKKALEIKPGSALAFLNLGLAYEKLGKKKEARKYLLKAANMGDKIAQKYLRIYR